VRIHRWLDFKVTNRCNCAARRCDYCDVPVDLPAAPERLPLALVHQTLVDARRLGFDTFWILGGEPSIRADVHHVVEPLADDRELRITIVTNGRIPNWTMVDSLFATRAQRACVQVSLDSLARENPKHSRPVDVLTFVDGIAERARAASRPDHSCAVEVHCVISRANLHDFDDFVRDMSKRRIPVSLAMVCPWAIVDEPRGLREFSRFELLDIAARIAGLRTGLPTDAFNPIVGQFVNRMLGNSKAGRRACGAGLTHLVINGDGAVHRCMAESFRPETALGTLTLERLHAILARVPSAMHCDEGPACFDGFAWDRLALGY